jgi:O-antigen/teichoic acid export membrane protein
MTSAAPAEIRGSRLSSYKSLFNRAFSLVARVRDLRGSESAQGPSFNRYKGVLLGGVFAGLSKFIGLVTVAISVPLTVRYLGAERYGMWMTISSLIALMSFADLGIGNGLVSALAAAHGQRSTDAMARLISSAFFMLAGLAVLVVAAFMLSYPFVPWARVFGVITARAASEAGPSVLVFVLCFAFGLPFTVVQRTQLGLQESWRASIWQSGASVISLLSVVLAAERAAGVAWLVLAMNGGSAMTNVLNTFVEFGIRKPELRPRRNDYDLGTVKRLLGASGIFVALQLCVLVGTESDQLIIAQIFGAAAVGPYAVTYKLFQTSLIFGLFMYPLWPALGEALGRRDYLWAQTAMNRATILSVSMGLVFAAALVIFGRPLIQIWVGGKIVADPRLIIAFSACIVMTAYSGALNALLNNAEFLRIQLGLYALASLVSLGLKIPLAYWLGPSGVVWATLSAFSMLYCLPAQRIINRYFQSAISSLA